MPRTFAIGDVHGCLTALNTLLDNLHIKPKDEFIFMGDLIDRGPSSKGVLEKVLEIAKVHETEVLFGNHEQMMLESRSDYLTFEDWLTVGGIQTLASYGWNPSLSDKGNWPDLIPETHWRFLEEKLLDVYELDRYFFVHASIDPEQPFDDQDTEITRWTRFDNPKPHPSGKKMITGHTAQKTGTPLILPHAMCIDTWVYGETGWLTAMEVNTERFFQANQAGEFRAWNPEEMKR